MGKFILKDKGNEFHFSFGRHYTLPEREERLDASKLDALVIEQGLEKDSQGRDIVNQMKAQGKPIYHVENEDLHKLAVKQVIGSALLTSLSTLDVTRQALNNKLTRRRFLTSGLIFGSGLTGLTPSILNAMNGPSENKSYSKEEMDNFNKDYFKWDFLTSKRNAVIAEGLVQLRKRHKILGIVCGVGHHNIYRYLLDDRLRKDVKGDWEPDIILI